MALTSEDITGRLTQVACELSCLANDVARDFTIGKYNTKKVDNYNLIVTYIDVINDNIPEEETKAIAKIEVTAGTLGTVRLFVSLDGITEIELTGVVSYDFTSSGSSQANINVTLADDLVTIINNYSSEFSASLEEGSAIIYIYGPDGLGATMNGIVIDQVITGDIVIPTIQEFSDGVDACTFDDVCLTEPEIDGMLTHMSELLKICYPPEGTDYTIIEETVTPIGILVTNSSQQIMSFQSRPIKIFL